jgi:hypothetical protein
MRALPTFYLAFGLAALVANDTGSFWWGLLACVSVYLLSTLVLSWRGKI